MGVKGMKITLVHAKYFNSWEALGLGYIGAYLKTKIRDLDLNYFQGVFDDDSTIVVGAMDSDIVAFSCTSPTFTHAVRLARQTKQANPRVCTVVGGYHPSAIPGDCLVEGINQVVVGEGEDAMVQIALGNRAKIVQGRPMNFSELPFPDRKLLKNERNVQVAYSDTGKRITSFQSHRACPFQCKYCLDGFNKVLYGGNVGRVQVRYRDVHNLLDEIETVTEQYQLDLIKFSDPTWNTSIEWVMDFCRAKIARGVRVPFYPNIHATISSDEMAELMAEANCYEIAVGIESGSPKILKQIGKGTSVQSIRRCVASFKKAGILIRGYFILGMPDETEEDLELTEQLAEELDLDEYGFTILCPYPGTQMYDSEKHRNIDWEKTDEYSNDFWESKHVSNQRLKEWQQKLTAKFAHKLTWHNRVLPDSFQQPSSQLPESGTGVEG